MSWRMRLIGYGRRLVRVAQWFATGTLLAGAMLMFRWWQVDRLVGSALLGVVLLTPGVVLFHFIRTLESLPDRLAVGRERVARGDVVRLAAGLSFLLRPWYWSLVWLSVLAGFVFMPLAVLVALT